ncbi:MAG: hypothetical protein P8L82_04120 [Paracoccaceae bacterium]|nr:hypothetical protein [Paracoccaceae bacterium]
MENDQKGLILDSYNIEGVTEEECRSIFFGWVLALDDSTDPLNAIRKLLATYEKLYPKHPMTKVLNEGLMKENLKGSRRGGRKKLKQFRQPVKNSNPTS